ncbi:WXG100 family type VII secretion target [Actinophytocola gossypii]|uniref:ESX-1 secretion-associated protein n=1 Tax=Actinophytocola gossypii TaxID=2812003 RepID=A0ABT2JH61_9PSEU|nr:type VII secretion target [Actinophytocola gossypii]MCT2587222.1 ESX-1 secretion-associated protein [Actinophytocola gossypii]
MTHFDVDLDQLRGHAGNVGDVADELSAIGGRLPSGLTDLALGVFARFLAAGVQDAMARVANTITDASSSVAELGDGLTRTAAAYQNTDETNATNLTEEYPR